MEKEITIYDAVNSPGSYYIGTPDEDDISAYAMRKINFPELAAYAKRKSIHGWIDLEAEEINHPKYGHVYRVIIPND